METRALTGYSNEVKHEEMNLSDYLPEIGEFKFLVHCHLIFMDISK